MGMATKGKAVPAILKADAAFSRRQQVIDAAAHVFARSGYHGAGTRAIAEKLGIKAASLYFHFSSKDDALEQVCVAGIEQPLADLHVAMAAESGFERRMRRFFAAHIERLRENSDYVTVFMHERRYLTSEATKRLNTVSRKFNVEFDRMVAEEWKEVQPPLPPRMARLVFIGLIRNLTEFYVDGSLFDFDDFAEFSIDHFLGGFGFEQTSALHATATRSHRLRAGL